MNKQNHFKFTKSELQLITVPDGKDYIVVYDTEVRGLACRISRGGTISFFLYRKVLNQVKREQLGRLPGMGVDEARRQALAMLGDIAKDKEGWLERRTRRDADSITIEDAFDLALKKAKRSEMAKRDWTYAKDKFVEWMKKYYPHITLWAKLRRRHVIEYLETKERLSPTRRRLDLQPICQTGRFMWREHEVSNVAEGLGLSAKLLKTPAPVYLHDVLLLLDFLKEKQLVSLEVGAALAGLAGLQLLEVLRLTWDKVDLRHGLIEISGEVKNEYRNRVIPIPRRCLDALHRARNSRPLKVVQDINNGHVVVSPMGDAFDGGSWMNYSKLLKGQMREWNPKIPWAPKDLRNCIMTLAALEGFSNDMLEQYVGHAPRTVTARNYIPKLSAESIGAAAQQKHQMNIFRNLVVDQVEAKIKEIIADSSGSLHQSFPAPVTI